jgi:hypothetical protein
MEAFLVILLWLIIFIFVMICLNKKKRESEYVIYIPNLNLITKNSNMIEKFEGENEQSLRCKYSLGGYKGSYDMTEYSPCCGVQPNLTLSVNPGLKPCENIII